MKEIKPKYFGTKRRGHRTRVGLRGESSDLIGKGGKPAGDEGGQN